MPNLRVGDTDMDALIGFLASDGRDGSQKVEVAEPKTGVALK